MTESLSDHGSEFALDQLERELEFRERSRNKTSKYVWDSDSGPVNLADMTDTHLQNAVAKLRRDAISREELWDAISGFPW